MRKKEPKERQQPFGYFPTRKTEEDVDYSLDPENAFEEAAEETMPEEEFDVPAEKIAEPEEAAPIEEAEAPAAEEIPTESADAPLELVDPEPTPEEVPVEEPIAATEPEPIPETPAPISAPPQEEEPPREYGAPQPLFEDIIPVGFSLDDLKKQRQEEKARIAAARRAEEEEKKRQKEYEAEEKKRQKEEETAAKKQAKADKKKNKSDSVAVVAAVSAEETKAEAPKAKAKKEKPEAPILDDNFFEEPEKTYSRAEQKLRRKYKLNNDILLSENDVVPGFVIAKGENVVRSYRCLSSKSGDGTICLTNKRLLINAGERSELGIEQVSGIKFSNFTRFYFIRFLLGLIFIGLGALMIALPFIKDSVSIPYVTGENYKSWFAYIFYPCGGISLLIGLPILFHSIKTSFYFYVYARMETPFLEYKSAVQAKRERKGKVFKYMIAKPGKESEKAARELGALIIEVKQGKYDN